MKAVLLCLALCAFPGLLEANAHETPPGLYLFKGSQLAPIGQSISIFEDETGKLQAGELLHHNGFERANSTVPNLGCSGSAFWLKCTVVNLTDQRGFVLQMAHPELDEIDIYYNHTNELLHALHGGQSRALTEVFPQNRDFTVLIPCAQNDQVTILIRIRSKKQLQAPVRLLTNEEYLTASQDRSSYAAGYIGMFLVLALYNLFLFLSVRDRNYLLYVLYLLSVLVTQLAFIGWAPTHLWPDTAFLLDRSSLILTISTAVIATEFFKRFIGTVHFTPRLHRGIPFFYVAFLISAVVYFGPKPWIGYQLTQAVSGLYAFYVLAIGMVAVRSGSRQAVFFLVAWSVFLIGTVVFVLKDAGVLPYNELTVYLMPVGSAIEGILLSFGLADRINVLRREKEASQAAALHAAQENERIIIEQNVTLEKKVLQRTQDLHQTNENLKQTQTKLVNAEKMASLGQLTAGIAHEINNPINFITSNIAPLRRNIGEIIDVMQGYRGIDPATAEEQLGELRKREEELGISESIVELDEIIRSMAEGSNRTAEIVRGLRNFSRLDEDDLKPIDLNEGIRSTLTLLGPQLRNSIAVQLDLGEMPLVECYPGKVNQVFMNVLTNAIQATIMRPDNSAPWIRISSKCDEDHVTITIADNGTGMTNDVKSRMFDPFFTTKAVGEGTGLGLAIVYGIIADHHGSISAESEPGRGSEFSITFPIRQETLIQQRA